VVYLEYEQMFGLPLDSPPRRDRGVCVMTVRRFLCGALLGALVALSPVAAEAIQSSDVILGFGSAYTAPDGSSCTHRGLDAAASPGSPVQAPVSGTVRFAGRVPGPHGGTVGAVTLETDQGLVSVLPVEGIEVSKGDSVERGDALGALSASGDPSSAGAHVHLSLRHGDLYVDPVVLLVAPPAPEQKPTPEVDPVTVPDPEPNGAPVATPAPSANAADALGSGSTWAPSGAGLGSRATQQTEAPATSLMGEGVSLASDSAALTVDLAAPSTSSRPSINADISATERLSRIVLEVGRGVVAWLRSAGTSGAVAISVGFLACFGLLGKQAFERRVASNPPVSDRLGKLLQQLRAGDTLRGLTSCSGLLPSQSRGRIAQRR